MTSEDQSEFTASWRIILGALVGIAGGFASLYFYAAGLFIKPMAQSFEWSRSEASIGAVVMSAACMIAFPITGRLADRVGIAKVAWISALLLPACFVMLGALTGGLLSFLFFVFLLTFLSSGSTPLTYNSIVVMHFAKRRGLALGVVLTGTGVGAVLIPIFLTPLIASQGWRTGYYALAIVALPTALISGLLLRGSGKARSSGPRPSAWLGVIVRRPVLNISAIIFMTATGVLGSTLHLVPMLTDRGLSAAVAGGFASAMGIAIIFGRVITGYLLDRLNPGIVTAVLLSLAGCGQLLLCLPSPTIAFLGAILLGFGLGTESDLMAFLLGRRVDPRNFATVYGAVFSVHAAGAGIGGYLAGLSYDLTGTYLSWLVLAAILLFAAALTALGTER